MLIKILIALTFYVLIAFVTNVALVLSGEEANNDIFVMSLIWPIILLILIWIGIVESFFLVANWFNRVTDITARNIKDIAESFGEKKPDEQDESDLTDWLNQRVDN